MTFQLKDTNTGSTLATTTVTVQSQSPTPVGAGVYDDRDSHLIYSGTWSQNNETDLYATTQSFSNQPSNSVSLTFTGTTVAYVYAMCYNIGKTEVRIDGSLVDTIDGYLYGPISNPNFNWQKIAVYSGLSTGNHTITVTATSQKNASATDNYTTIDAFIVGQIYNDSASGFTYYAGWSTSVGYPVFWGGDQHYTDTPGYYVSRNFTGSSATVIFTYAPNAGIAQVTVDGVVVGTIDQYGPNVNSTDPTYFRISRTYSGFSSGTHQLKVTCTGNYNPLSTYLGINIDAVITPQ